MPRTSEVSIIICLNSMIYKVCLELKCTNLVRMDCPRTEEVRSQFVRPCSLAHHKIPDTHKPGYPLSFIWTSVKRVFQTPTN